MKKILALTFALFLACLVGCGAKYDEKTELAQLRTDLAALTAAPRPVGSEGEAGAADYLAERFTAMGLTVTKQEYTAGSGLTGANVIAAHGEGDESDILVISAHHDSIAASFGANDDASGAAALLMIANRLAQKETDTELRFISFTDEEGGKNGSRFYVDSLSEAEKERLIGCIQLDMLGGLGSTGAMIATVDGSPNYLTDLFTAHAEALPLGAETGSDHATFQLSGVPAVVVTQQGRGYLYHTMGDTAGALDAEAIHASAALTFEAVAEIADNKTPSYVELAKAQAGSYLYAHARSSKIFYYMPREENEAYLGITGTLADTWEESGDGWVDTYEAYAYEMQWFGGEAPMTTHYIYRNGYLEAVKIYPGGAYTEEELKALITATHGEALPTEGGWNWEDQLYGKFIGLTQGEITVYPYSLGMSNTLGSYEVKDGEAVITDAQHAKVWELFCSAIPKEHRGKIGEFSLFTDGYSNMLAFASTMGSPEAPDNTRFSITVDYYDVYDENGAERDESKLLYTLIHEYGHVLLENDTQIDLSLSPDLHDPATFVPGSFRQRYYDAFWQDPYESYLGSYWDAPENYVSEYAGNMFHEDIADTFAVFVFGAKPTGDTVAEEKLLFFWAEPDMVTLRAEIRQGLGLE